MFVHSHRRTSILLALLAMLALTAGAPISAQPAAGQAGVQTTTNDSDTAFRSSPVMFIENAGQWPEAARFQVWGAPAGTMWLAEDAVWVTVVEQTPVADSQADRLQRLNPAAFELQPADLPPARGVNIKLSFVDANPYPRIEPFDRLDTVVSYFIGSDPDQWRPDVPVWGGVRYVDLYPGVGLEVTSEGGRMVPRLDAQPGADLSAVRLRVEGADSIAVDDAMLRLSTAAGDAIVPLLRADGRQADRFQVTGPRIENAQFSEAQAVDVAAPFAPGNADRQAQIANPQSVADNPADLLYSTYLGGSSSDQGNAIAVDGSGAAYVAGWTNSTDFPTTPGAFDRSHGGNHDAFAAKLNPAGSALLYATFLGGGNNDQGRSIAVDGSGAAYITGLTNSAEFPATSGGFDRSFGGGTCGSSPYTHPCSDAFAAKLDPSGSALAYATFLGGSNDDEGLGIAVDGSGAAYLTGFTRSADFPTTPGAFDRSYNGGYADAFVVKVNPAGSALAYATFLGASDEDYGDDLAIDGAGNAIVAGSTCSRDFPTTFGAYNRGHSGGGAHDCADVFIAKLSSAGSGLAYGTFVGGSDGDWASGLAVDGTGCAYVTGTTTSFDFPTTSGAFDRSYGGGSWAYDTDAFVLKLNPAGDRLAYATFLGATNNDWGDDLVVDRQGRTYVTGGTWSSDFPTSADAFDQSPNYGEDFGDAFVVKVNPTGSGLAYATFLGGSGGDWGNGIAVDSGGAAYITGETESADFPTTPGAFDRSYNGFQDAFVVKLAMGGASTPTPTPTSTRTPTPTVTPTPTRTPTPTPLPDLRVARIEVAQVFVEQYDPISGTPIPLIAKKDTLVRVYVGVNGAASVGGVSARLHIRQPNGTETVDSRPVNVWPVQAKQTPDPFSLQDTINFRPATKLLQGNVTFWADVDPANRIPETNESNNTGGQVSRTFEAGKPVRIAITQIGYRSFPWDPYAYSDWNTIARADAMLGRVYPVAAGDVQYYYQPGDPARVQCLWGNQDACWAEFHNQLQIFWRRVDDEGKWVSGTRPHALVGWVPGAARDAGGTCGEANLSGRREVVIADYCDKYMGNPPTLTPEPVARVLAHEVGHLLNTKPELQHAKNLSNKDDPQCNAEPDGQDPLYPTPPSYPTGSIFAHGLDIHNLKVLEPSKAPRATYDLMSYCSPAWVSPYNYFKLNSGFTGTAAAQASNAEPDAPVRKLLVSGLVFTPTLQVELNPFYVLNTTSAADANSGTDYCLETRNASGVVLDKRCFDLAFVNRETYAPASVDGFALAIPYPAGAAQIVLTHLGTPITTQPVSAHAPTVLLLSPNGGETWAGTNAQTVTWTASDLDGDPLHFALAYSTDGGASWIPAGSDLTGTQHALDVSLLPGGTSVLLRISATDGVNTTDDVSDAPFTVGRKAPQAFILSPEDGARFFPGAAIWLEGRAFDLEDGTLDDAALRWSSDRDGVLGTGKLLIATLSPGEHVITLTATDSDGARTTAMIRLSAGDRVFLPLVLRGR